MLELSEEEASWGRIGEKAGMIPEGRTWDETLS